MPKAPFRHFWFHDLKKKSNSLWPFLRRQIRVGRRHEYRWAPYLHPPLKDGLKIVKSVMLALWTVLIIFRPRRTSIYVMDITFFNPINSYGSPTGPV